MARSPVSSLAPLPICTEASLSTTLTPTPITAGTAPIWPGVSEMVSDWSLSARTVMLLAATSLPSMVTRE